MPNILASSILNKALILLMDPAEIRFTKTELLGWLNDGQREIVQYKPTAHLKKATVTLAEGSAQALPEDAVSLLRVVRNMGTSGSTPGKAVTPVTRQLMDAHKPTWHTTTPSATVDHFMYDEADEVNTFYVYPPQPPTPSKVQLQYYAIPADVAAANDPIVLPNVWATALLDYVMYRAYCKEIEQGEGQAKAAAHLQAFLLAVKGAATDNKAS